ncbi:diacylglycerol kinase [Secundilactobacillus oryzae JCM 18671]|uniref:Diacylglycerol kinase n=1 Tax=Secundilactobacillus oryzae JCM 18671 TaxID=1291743 RepID=A0A081BGQ8_9LACO|nr:diacylglycerol kinase family protein [Secundilactobacillus oryzae]GAK47226.1 diacylglycerol kinase [Secundilactobacillus oryzae JCM 18671]
MAINFYIIINETAGGGKTRLLWPEIKQELDQRNTSYDFTFSTYPEHTVELAEHWAKHLDLSTPEQPVLLAIGGDGTLHEALTGLVKANRAPQIPVAYLPIGSGNDFARGMGMATNWHSALNQILNCTHASRINIGTYNDTIKYERGVFTNNLGIGFDAAVVSKTNHSPHKERLNKFNLGSLSYIASIIGVLYNQEAFPLTVHIDHKRDIYSKAYLVTVSNHPYFGGGVKIMPPASVKDEALDLIVIEKHNIFALLLLLLTIFRGKHLKYKAVHHYHGQNIQLSIPSIEYGQVDGEEMGGRYWDLYLGTSTYPIWIDPTL